MTGATLTPPRLDRVPVIPEPPHDPTSILLDGRTGWRPVEPGGLIGLDVSPCDGALTLGLKPGLVRQFAEASGSFGGLVPPANVAVASDGSVFLLDPRTRTLRKFDPCCCRFVEVPCLGATSQDARDLQRPGGIAICCDVLYATDAAGDGRVSVFLLPGYELRGHLRPPVARFARWQPVDVACDPRGGLWVADALNGAIHRFTRRGRWRTVITGLDEPVHVAVDRSGRVYVIDRSAVDGVGRLRVFDPSGEPLVAPSRVDEAARRFAPLPFTVTAEGLLSLGGLCEPPCEPPATAVFDTSGLTASLPAPDAAPYLTSGTYASRALDSRTRGCQWHRVVVSGELPPGTRIVVETFAADEEYDADQIAAFAVWDAREIATASPIDEPVLAAAQRARPGTIDCLVPSPPGRFLWLKVTLAGSGVATPIVRALVIEFPRLSSLRYLPAVFGAEPASADFTARFLSVFDTTLREIERDVDTEARLFDPLSAPADRVGRAPTDVLSWLASWIGVSFDRRWSEPTRRRFLKAAGKLFARRGTVAGLREQLLAWLGWHPPVDCGPASLPLTSCAGRPANCAPEPARSAYDPPPLVLEHFRLRRWLFVGAARLGAQAVLWGQQIVNRTQLDRHARADRTRLITTPDPKRDPLHFYAHGFTVFVPACVGRTESARRSFEGLLRRESPAHTRWDVAYVEPRFRIGVQSMIGFDAVVACLPAPGRLGETTLGSASLVASATRRDGRAEPRAGRTGRVGTGLKLQ